MTAKKAAAPKKAAESEDAPRKGGKTYRVSAPLIQVTVGEQVLQYSEGAVLPGGIDKDQLDHLSDLGFIESE